MSEYRIRMNNFFYVCNCTTFSPRMCINIHTRKLIVVNLHLQKLVSHSIFRNSRLDNIVGVMQRPLQELLAQGTGEQRASTKISRVLR